MIENKEAYIVLSCLIPLIQTIEHKRFIGRIVSSDVILVLIGVKQEVNSTIRVDRCLISSSISLKDVIFFVTKPSIVLQGVENISAVSRS